MTARTGTSPRPARRALAGLALATLAALGGCGWRGPHGGMQGGMQGGDPSQMPGWSMMSQAERAQHRAHMPLMSDAERQAHHEQMRGMKTRAECEAYMARHHAQMAARAKERGMTMPEQPMGQGCSWMAP